MAKKIIGIFLFIVGLLALVTPFTPGSWLIFVGLEFLGFRILFWDMIKARFSAKGETTGGQTYDPQEKNKIKR